MFKYFPHTGEEIKAMLEKIGVSSIDELFSTIDPQLIQVDPLNLPSSLSEHEIRQEINHLANKNTNFISFLGAGSYDPFIFSAVSALASRQEFLTSYTPYQPEISQGTLQYIFEFQSMIAELTGMDVANASMYDGATATAEAMFMATAHTKRNKVLISCTLNPTTYEVVKTYAKYRGLKIEQVKSTNYLMDINDLEAKLDHTVAALIVGYPNYYGYLESFSLVNELVHNNGSLLVFNSDPSALAILKSPREWGADIVCGEAQSLGISPSFGGPYLGYFATTKALVRKMPGRICGMTKDVDGKRGFVLTLQAREQHIRREKANSNICSNQSLMALSAVIYMSLLGKQGLIDVAQRAYDNAHYLKAQLLATKRFKEVTNAAHHKEFVLEYLGDLPKLERKWQRYGFLGGLVLNKNTLLLCAHETRSQEEIDYFVEIVGDENV